MTRSRATTAAVLDAGFDGVELHGANGYLIEQFLNPLVNVRSAAHGGSIEGSNRLALEIARATVSAIGLDRVGIRLSTYGVFNGTGAFPECTEDTSPCPTKASTPTTASCGRASST